MIRIVIRLTPAQALAWANEQQATVQLQRAIAADLARLIAALPKAPTSFECFNDTPPKG